MSFDDSVRRVLVTGASGFIGGSLSRRLMDEGLKVRCHYRRPDLPENLEELAKRGAELIRLDLAPPLEHHQAPESCLHCSQLIELMKGIDLVYHIAALTSDWGPRASFERANVQAAESVVDAAANWGVKRFVYVSSLSVHGFGPHRNSTEAGPYYPPTHSYQATKRRAEGIVLSRMSKDFEVCVIRPGNVYGPRDTTMIFPIFDALRKGIMGTVGGGRALTPPVFIDDLLDALIAAGTLPEAAGETVNITGEEDITWREFIEAAAGALGENPPRIDLPTWIAAPLARVFNVLWTAAGAKKAPPITPYRVKQLSNDFHFDMSKARRLLKYQPKISCEAGLEKAAESYREV